MFVYCPPKEIPKIESQTFPDGKRYYVTPDGKKLPSVSESSTDTIERPAMAAVP